MTLAGLLASTTVPAMGLCLSGHPTVAAETADVPLVVTARVVDERALFEDEADAQGVTATVYSVGVTGRLKGSPPAQLEIYSENTSSRFPMDVNSEYILWLSTDGTRYFVDSCGNSTTLLGHTALLRDAQLATTAR